MLARSMVALAICFISSGCTADRLRTSVVAQTETITQLQYQQVLGNLARLQDEPSAIPSQVTLHDGSAQVQDFGTGGLGLDDHSGVIGHQSLGGSRTIVEQWGERPVTDDVALRLLRLAYQRAIGIGFSLQSNPDLANDLAHELKKQISWPEGPLPRTGGLIYANQPPMHDPNRSVGGLAPPQDAALRRSVAAQEPPGDLPEAIPDEANIPGDTYKGLKLGGIRTTDQRSIVVNEIFESVVRDKILGRRVLSTNSEDIIVESDFKTGLANLDVLLKDDPVICLVTPSAREVRRLVKEAEHDLLKIHGGWVHYGGKKDVPKEACYVGRCGDRYAWVCRDGREPLAELTLVILGLSDLIKENSIVTSPGGPRFTPSPSAR